VKFAGEGKELAIVLKRKTENSVRKRKETQGDQKNIHPRGLHDHQEKSETRRPQARRTRNKNTRVSTGEKEGEKKLMRRGKNSYQPKRFIREREEEVRVCLKAKNTPST